MNRRTRVAFGAFGLAGLAGLALVVNLGLNEAQQRYPGSVRLSDENLDNYALQHGSIIRQAVYQTPDVIQTVRRWYMARLGVPPASDLATSGDCMPLVHARLVLKFEHSVSVMLCAMPHGTRVVVNERLTLWN